MERPNPDTTFNDVCALTAFVVTVMTVATLGNEHPLAAVTFATVSLCGFFAACVSDFLQVQAGETVLSHRANSKTNQPE